MVRQAHHERNKLNEKVLLNDLGFWFLTILSRCVKFNKKKL
jgi:hypothetical protein